MDTSDEGIDRLLEALADAKTWPERFKDSLASGADVSGEILAADKKIEALKGQAQAAMKRLGCVSPQTRPLYNAMADMLISWNTFKDTL